MSESAQKPAPEKRQKKLVQILEQARLSPVQFNIRRLKDRLLPHNRVFYFEINSRNIIFGLRAAALCQRGT